MGARSANLPLSATGGAEGGVWRRHQSRGMGAGRQQRGWSAGIWEPSGRVSQRDSQTDARRGEGRGQEKLIPGSDLSLGVPAAARPSADGVPGIANMRGVSPGLLR